MTIRVVTLTIIWSSAMLSSVTPATLGLAFPPFLICPSSHPRSGTRAYLLNTPGNCHYQSFVLIVPVRVSLSPLTPSLAHSSLSPPGPKLGPIAALRPGQWGHSAVFKHRIKLNFIQNHRECPSAICTKSLQWYKTKEWLRLDHSFDWIIIVKMRINFLMMVLWENFSSLLGSITCNKTVDFVHLHFKWIYILTF